MTKPKHAKTKTTGHNKAAPKDVLRMPTKRSKKKYGVMCFALIGDYKGRGKQKVILHEIEIGKKTGEIQYGHKRHWVFPTR